MEIQDEAKRLIEKKLINPNKKRTERLTITKARIYQDVLKRYVSLNYYNCCALCENDQPELLVASHIVPWKSDESKRLNLDNCILFCNFHDKLFDKGFITINDDFTISVSEKLSPNVIKQIKDISFKLPQSEYPNIHQFKAT